jgi:hypothetical protein
MMPVRTLAAMVQPGRTKRPAEMLLRSDQKNQTAIEAKL